MKNLVLNRTIDTSLLEESIEQLIETKCVDANTDHETLSVCIHNLADQHLTDYNIQGYSQLLYTFMYERNIIDDQLWDYLGIGDESRDLPFVCYHIVVHLLFELLEKDKFIKLLPNALDEDYQAIEQRKHFRQLAEEDTKGFEDPIDFIQLIASLYERLDNLKAL